MSLNGPREQTTFIQSLYSSHFLFSFFVYTPNIVLDVWSHHPHISKGFPCEMHSIIRLNEYPGDFRPM